jgi:broad specificity phosphatase PhoE
MTMLLLIRHAETDLAGTFCGHLDPALNQRGLAQIPALLRELEQYSIQGLYASDLRRARQTAEAIAARFGLQCHIREGLRELFFGRWEGLRWEEIELRDPQEAKIWAADYSLRDFPSGENLHDFRIRVHREVDAILSGSNHSLSAVVTHAGVMRTVLTDYAGLSLEQAWQQTKDYGAIIRASTSVASAVTSNREEKCNGKIGTEAP